MANGVTTLVVSTLQCGTGWLWSRETGPTLKHWLTGNLINSCKLIFVGALGRWDMGVENCAEGNWRINKTGDVRKASFL